MTMSTNPVRRNHSGHFDIHMHYVRELWLWRMEKLIPLRPHDMVTDAFPRSLPASVLVCHRSVMMGHTVLRKLEP